MMVADISVVELQNAKKSSSEYENICYTIYGAKAPISIIITD